MMMRASEPPMKLRLPAESAILSMCIFISILQFGYPSKKLPDVD
jgi:hypothetical protein